MLKWAVPGEAQRGRDSGLVALGAALWPWTRKGQWLVGLVLPGVSAELGWDGDLAGTPPGL